MLFTGMQLSVAQIKPVIHFSEDDGLADNLVWDLLLDTHNILWIATNNGLSKFDGTSFTNLYKKNGLPSDKIGALCLGENDKLYAACSYGGIVTIEDNEIKNELRFYTDNSKHICRTLHYSKKHNQLFIGTENGLYMLIDSTLIEIEYHKDISIRSIVLSFIETPAGIYFSVLKGKSAGLYQLDYNQYNPRKTKCRRIDPIRKFSLIWQNGKLHGSEGSTLQEFTITNSGLSKIESLPDSSFFIWRMASFKNGLLWLGGLQDGRFPGGIRLYDPKQGKFIPFDIPDNTCSVNKILFDKKSGVTWFGSSNGLIAYKESLLDYISLKGEKIIDKAFIGDSLIILTKERVIYRKNESNETLLTKNQIKAYIESKYREIEKKYSPKERQLFDLSLSLEFTSLWKHKNQLYIQTSWGGAPIPELNKFIPCGNGPVFLKENYNTGQTGMYAATNYTPVSYLPDINKPNEFIELESTPNIDYKITSVLEYNNVLYFASQFNGLLTINEEKISRLNSENSSLGNSIIGMDVGPGGEIVCLTGNNHIYRVEYIKEPKIIGELDIDKMGVVGDIIKWLKFSGQHLYIGTNAGLNIIESEGIKCTNADNWYKHANVAKFYNHNNGYSFISAGHPILDPCGNLVVHTNDEIIRIKTDTIANTEPTINIYNLSINDNIINISDIAGKIMPYSTQQISFNFRGIRYPSARNLKYRYNINNEGWNQGNQIIFQSIRPGEYFITLEMLDLENNKLIQRNLSFSIAAPFWNTWWFGLVTLTIAIILAYGLFRLRYNRIREREMEKSRLVMENSELQLRSLQFQMNPHFLFNALTSLQSSILRGNINESLDYLNNVSSIIRTNLSNAGKDYVLVAEEIEFLQKYIKMELVRFEGKLKIELKNESNVCHLLMPPMIIQPLIENSIKHSINPQLGTGQIWVEFKKINETLQITVKDNGIGRAASQSKNISQHEHFGLSTIGKRLELLNCLDQTGLNTIKITDLNESNNYIKDNNSPAVTGTVVTINLSLKWR
jgi:ligand-binding sensor domain-containing protein/signal transduction histidine kinase